MYRSSMFEMQCGGMRCSVRRLGVGNAKSQQEWEGSFIEGAEEVVMEGC